MSQNSIGLTPVGVVTSDGAGNFTGSALTQHGVLLGGASNAISSLGVAPNNSVLMGDGGTDPAFLTNGTAYFTAISFDNGDDLLNAYIVGGFAPTIQGDSTVGSTTYVSQQGTYAQIGNIVTLSALVSWSSTTATGNLQISSLPVPVSAGDLAVSFCVYTGTTSAGTTAVYVSSVPSTSLLNVNTTNVISGINAQLAVPVGASTIQFSITYSV